MARLYIVINPLKSDRTPIKQLDKHPFQTQNSGIMLCGHIGYRKLCLQENTLFQKILSYINPYIPSQGKCGMHENVLRMAT